MKKRKKLTYVDVDLFRDDSVHLGYEKALNRIQPELGRSHPLIIGGSEIFSEQEFDAISPVDRRIVIGKFQNATPAQMRSAIAAARDGFPAWQNRDWKERIRIMQRTAGILDSQKFLLAALITCECGKNRYEAIVEVQEAVDMLR
jgi:1-pyrroline-5-carboxylate dehydrogenase